MSNAEEMKEQVRRTWGSNAATWDAQHESMERQTHLVTPWLCKAARIASGMRVLDLASGTGHPALEEARLVFPGGSVVASDLAPEMVEALRRRAEEAGLANLEARVIDAEAIDYPDESFDGVTMRFGLMFCPEPGRAAGEVRRVLRSGGWFALSAWDDLAKSPAHTVVNQALVQIGRPDPRTERRGTPFGLSAPGELAGALQAGGFESFEIESLAMQWHFESTQHFWDERALRYPHVRQIINEGDEAGLERLKVALYDILAPYVAGDGRLSLTATALCAAARK